MALADFRDGLTLSQTSATVGAGQFTLTVNRSGTTQFHNDSVVTWTPSGGSLNSLTTTFVSSTRVTAIGPATLVASAGTASITVTNTNGNPPGTVTFTINAAATSTSVASSLSPSAYGQSMTFTATVSNTSTGAAPSGSVEFFDGLTDLGAGTLGTSSGNQTNWTFTTAALNAGSHTIKATFSGSNGTRTQTVNPKALSYTIGNDSQTYGTPVALATDLGTTIATRCQRAEPEHCLQQHGRHHHGPRRYLRHHGVWCPTARAWPATTR